MSKMKKIILHGKLKELYDKPIEVEASTIAEAMRSLQFIPELQPADGQPWPVTIQGVNSEIALYSETSQEEIHVYPRLSGGGGKAGLLEILLGITLIALSFVLPFAAGGLMATICYKLFFALLIARIVCAFLHGMMRTSCLLHRFPECRRRRI